MGNSGIVKKKQRDNKGKISIPFIFIWRKCPKCRELNYRKELEKTNKCYFCGYLFPYPIAKVQKIEELRATNPSWNELSDLILKMLGTITEPSQRTAFISQALGIAVSYHERWICSKCTKKKE